MRPLMPRSDGIAVGKIGEHTVSFRPQPGTPEWAKIQAVYQEDYRRIRSESQAGLRQGQLHRKYLGATARKIAVDYHELIPADLPDEGAVEPTTSLSDNFDRADNDALGTASGGGTWTEVVNDWDISSDTAVATINGLCLARLESDLSSDDMWVQLYVPQISDEAGVCGRFDSAGQTYYAGLLSSRIFKYISGTPTQVGSTGTAMANSSVAKLYTNGSDLILLDDGVVVVSTTDTAITGNTRAGIYGQTATIADDFLAADIIDEAIWQLTDELTSPSTDDLLVAVDDPSGTPSTKKLALSALQALALSTVVVQTKTVGSGTYTPTTGMKKVLGIAVGGGGGGGGGINTDSVGGGGGGGGTVIRLMTAADIGASKAYVVGAGGAAANNGTATTLDTAGALMNAGGGSLGSAGATSTTVGTTTAGGAGGTAANGDLNIPGQPGERGTTYDGTNGIGGKGGSSALGHGGGPGGANVAGTNGTDYGGGGAGGHASATQNRDGGAGANGILYLIEFIG